MKDEAAVDYKEIHYAEATVVFCLTNVLPRAEVERTGRILFLNTSPPESPNDRSNFFDESFGEAKSTVDI